MSLLLIGLICWLAVLALVLALLRAAALGDRAAERREKELGPAPAALEHAAVATGSPRRTRAWVLTCAAAAVTLIAGVMSARQLAGAIAVAALPVAVGLCGWALAATVVASRRGTVVRRQAGELARQRDTVLGLVLRLLSVQDPGAGQHAAAVAHYARTLAAAAGLSERDQLIAHSAGLLHDLGLYLPLDGHRIYAVDPELIRGHPLTGARWVRTVAGLEEVAAVLEAHHERIDGTGYPHGLRGDDIPQSARIIAIAEVYDVLTAPGSYRSGHTHEWAAEELRKAIDRQLDARLVELFLAAIPEPAARPSLDRELIAARRMATRVHAHATTV